MSKLNNKQDFISEKFNLNNQFYVEETLNNQLPKLEVKNIKLALEELNTNIAEFLSDYDIFMAKEKGVPQDVIARTDSFSKATFELYESIIRLIEELVMYQRRSFENNNTISASKILSYSANFLEKKKMDIFLEQVNENKKVLETNYFFDEAKDLLDTYQNIHKEILMITKDQEVNQDN